MKIGRIYSKDAPRHKVDRRVQYARLNFLLGTTLYNAIVRAAKKSDLSKAAYMRAAARTFIMQHKQDGYPALPPSLYRY